MKINVELNANDLVSADKETLLQLVTTLTGIAQTEVGKPKTEATSVEVKPETENPTEKPATKKHTKKRASKVEPKAEAPKEEEVTEDPANNEDTLELDEVPITRDSVKARLKELSVAGKSEEIKKKVFAPLNVVKFSELTDEQLPKVMKMVEDL
nr:MAG TPA: hypothetical protein [Caudoviricetes sp.]